MINHQGDMAMNRHIIKGNKKGFTLVEIIVVLIIIAILAAIAIPAFTQYIDKSRIGVMEHNQGQVLRPLQLLTIEGEFEKDNSWVRDAIKKIGVFVTNPLSKGTETISSSQVASRQGPGIIVSKRAGTKSPEWDDQIRLSDSNLYPFSAVETSGPKCEGSVIIQVVNEGVLVY